ncbi:MAG: hypothetical protein ACON38_10430 [Akkermansiaceae bacterium]
MMLSDRAAKESPLETFFLTNFSNVTEVRHGDFSNPNSVLSQDALLGKGRFSGKGQDVWRGRPRQVGFQALRLARLVGLGLNENDHILTKKLIVS